METSFTLTYKEEIEALKEYPNFEELGDKKYMFHEDDEARLEWAFYRPSGSHPDQVSDPNVLVSIMAFNHSRLGAKERFERLHEDVIREDKLRVKVRNRSRMLFRAMIDDDFFELVEVLKKYPQFLDLSYDQMINGRIWNETYADAVAASRYLDLAKELVDNKLYEGLKRRLQPIKEMSVDEAKTYLDILCASVSDLHPFIKEHYADLYQKWIQKTNLHPLQQIVWKKQIDIIKEKQCSHN
jgi:hypothetical protein